jgi:tRNA threonylcarbamoyladenosine biosynthesis protein TsaB
MRPMKVLAVDTTSNSGSAAILDGDVLKGHVGFSRRPGYAEKLLPTVELMLEELSLTLLDLDGLAVAAGPGSFTGLRIGIATMEGLAYATGRPIVGVSSLEATAYRYRHRDGYVASFLDARRKEIFGALYRVDGRQIQLVNEPVCESPEKFIARLPAEPILLAGTGTLVYRERLSRQINHDLLLAEPSFFLAEDVARLGSKRLQMGDATALGKLEAIYLRASDAEIAKQPGASGPRTSNQP